VDSAHTVNAECLTHLNVRQKKMKATQALWLATSEVSDFFSLMGGANRPSWMVDSHIFLYVAAEASRLIGRDDRKEYPEVSLVAEALGSRKARIHEILGILPSIEDARFTIAEYASHYDSKLRPHQRCASWTELSSELKISK